jgi:hypothetical protein
MNDANKTYIAAATGGWKKLLLHSSAAYGILSVWMYAGKCFMQ